MCFKNEKRGLLQLEHQVIALLVQNMERLDETVKEESEGVFHTLGRIFQTIIHAPSLKDLCLSYSTLQGHTLFYFLSFVSRYSREYDRTATRVLH